MVLFAAFDRLDAPDLRRLDLPAFRLAAPTLRSYGVAVPARLDEACRATARGLLGKLSNKNPGGLAPEKNPSHPWGMAFEAIEKLQPPDPRVKHLVLSRAHLP